VVGQTFEGTTQVAFIWENGGMHRLPSVLDHKTALAINDQGFVVGEQDNGVGKLKQGL
jgi:hypothetical protein